ncbi:MAG: hypothetical protein ACOCNJ_05470, partial [Bacteroidales bacterium]
CNMCYKLSNMCYKLCNKKYLIGKGKISRRKGKVSRGKKKRKAESKNICPGKTVASSKNLRKRQLFPPPFANNLKKQGFLPLKAGIKAG